MGMRRVQVGDEKGSGWDEKVHVGMRRVQVGDEKGLGWR